MVHQGGCHCGKVSYTVDGDIDQVIQCNCSICAKRGYLLWFVSRSSLHPNIDPEDLSTYTFNKHRIRHYFCPTCGVAPFGIGLDGSGREMVAVNVRCLENVDPATLKTVPFDGRSI